MDTLRSFLILIFFAISLDFDLDDIFLRSYLDDIFWRGGGGGNNSDDDLDFISFLFPLLNGFGIDNKLNDDLDLLLFIDFY